MANREDRIKQRAYEIWEQEGRPHGEDLKHWLQAFKELGDAKDDREGAAASKANKTSARRTQANSSARGDATSSAAGVASAAGKDRKQSTKN